MKYIFTVLFLILSLSAQGKEKNIGKHKKTTIVSSNLIVSSKCEKGNGCLYTSTLTTHLGRLLDYAQDVFGEKKSKYTLLGYNFTNKKNPNNWFPSYGENKRNYFIIQITRSGLRNEREAIHQLAHEVIHLLFVDTTKTTTTFEEGLAEFFSLWYINNIYYNNEELLKETNQEYANRLANRDDKYGNAVLKLKKLISSVGGFKDFGFRVKKLRVAMEKEESNGITEELLLQIFPEMSVESAKYFYKW